MLIDNDAFITKMLASYASRLGRKDVEVRNVDIVSTAYEAGSLGLANLDYVLHYMSEGQIADAISRLVPALAHNGLMHITEPEAGCCGLESPEKISAMRTELGRHGLFVAEKKAERGGRILRSERVCIVEFVAARREEDLERARPLMSLARF